MAIPYTADDVNKIRQKVPKFDDFSAKLRAAAASRGPQAERVTRLLYPVSFEPTGGTGLTFEETAAEVGLSTDEVTKIFTAVVHEAGEALHGKATGESGDTGNKGE